MRVLASNESLLSGLHEPIGYESSLVLDDGTLMGGIGIGADVHAEGELVFTTAMNGYPESLTDPSYKGQVLVISHPLVGNYGVPEITSRNGIVQNMESEGIKVSGLVVSELTSGSGWNSAKTLDSWLKENGIPGISGVDTRSLIKRIRNLGASSCAIIPGKGSKSTSAYRYDSINFAESVSPREHMVHDFGSRDNIVIVDFGVKHGILRSVSRLGYNIIRVPYNYTEKQILSFSPAGIVYSNGPGNPNLLSESAKTLGKVLENSIPTLSICLGHQLTVLSMGGRIRKMRSGHRAINKAVVDTSSGRSYITTHNHGYAAYAEDVPEDIERWFISPDDNVVEGIRGKNLLSVQFHPESGPGTADAEFIFKHFERMMRLEAK